MSFVKTFQKSKLTGKISEWYANQSGYRAKGLFADDLLITENDRMQEALRRLPHREFYDRIFRIRRAISLTTNQEELPKTQWTTQENDKPYLTEMVAGVDAEVNDKQYFDQMVGIPSELKQKNKYIRE